MIRWKYVLPRLSLLAIMVGCVWFCADWLIKLTLVQAGQMALGSRVEIGSLDTSVARGNLTISQVVIADPNASFRNLLQADSATFDLETYAALRKKLIIREGVIEGLKFSTPRETDGVLDQKANDAAGESSFVTNAKKLGQRGEAWVDASIDNFEAEFDNELHSVQLGKELKERWPAQYKQIAADGKRLESEAKQLSDQIQQIADDPLANAQQIPAALAAVDDLRRKALNVRQQFAAMQQQMKQDRIAIQQAKEHDTQYLRERLKLDQLDGDSLTEYLLGPIWSERVEMALRWIQRSRDAVETTEQLADDTVRGINVLFPGFPASADVLIRSLRLTGGGTDEGSEYTFQGVARNLTHQPQRHGEPATIDIQSEGSIQMVAQGILDRRGKVPKDRFVVTLPKVAQHGQVLGKPEKLAVEVSPGHANIVADIVVEAKALSGTISLRQEQIELTPRFPEKYTRYIQPENLKAATSGVNQLAAVVTLSGTLKKPKYKLQSNLGPQLATGLNRAVQQELLARQEQLVQKANDEVQQQLNQLQQDLVAKHGDILKNLEVGDGQLDALKRQLTSRLGAPADLIGLGKKLFRK